MGLVISPLPLWGCALRNEVDNWIYIHYHCISINVFSNIIVGKQFLEQFSPLMCSFISLPLHFNLKFFARRIGNIKQEIHWYKYHFYWWVSIMTSNISFSLTFNLPDMSNFITIGVYFLIVYLKSNYAS